MSQASLSLYTVSMDGPIKPKQKGIRCRGRKNIKTCLKPPVVCNWSEEKKQCDMIKDTDKNPIEADQKPEVKAQPTKQARCTGRKTAKTCLKPPTVCNWSEDQQKCTNKSVEPQEPAIPVEPAKPEEPVAIPPKAAPTVRCAARKSVKTCTKSTDACMWLNEKCIQRSQAPIVDKAVIEKDLEELEQLDPAPAPEPKQPKALPKNPSKPIITKAKRAEAMAKIRAIRAYYAAPMNDRMRYARRVGTILAKYQLDSCDVLAKTRNKQGFQKVKRIGSASVYGETHLVKNIDIPLRPLYVAVKIAPKNTPGIEREIQNYESATKLVKRYISPHFPVVYGYNLCDHCEYENPRILANKRSTKKCYYIFNELAAGDLKTWIKQQASKKTWEPEEVYHSMVTQLLMGLFALHWALNMTHADLHWGNVLWHDTSATKGGYWHYQMIYSGLTQNIYIKNTGQLWVLWDFGMMSQGYYDPRDTKRILYFPKWAEKIYKATIPAYMHKVVNKFKDLSAYPSADSDIEAIRRFADNKTVWWNTKPTDGPIINLGRPYVI